MPGSSFLAIIPPAEVVEAVVRIQQAAGIYEPTWPHITVKAQPGHPDPAEPVAAVPRFDVALTGVGWFGDRVVFLAVDGPVDRLNDALGGDPDFVPHLTLAMERPPETMALVADLAACQPWPTFTVEAVTELHRDADDQPYRPVRGFLLSP